MVEERGPKHEQKVECKEEAYEDNEGYIMARDCLHVCTQRVRASEIEERERERERDHPANLWSHCGDLETLLFGTVMAPHVSNGMQRAWAGVGGKGRGGVG